MPPLLYSIYTHQICITVYVSIVHTNPGINAVAVIEEVQLIGQVTTAVVGLYCSYD
jgi:hypothetical protein